MAIGRFISHGMKPPTRRHRHSNKPLADPHAIDPRFLHDRQLQALKWLEPYHYCKYATAPWLHFLADPKVEYSVFRKQLGYLREEPNNFIGCPDQQLASPNTNYKHLVYELRERGLNELVRRGLTTKRVKLEPETRPKKRRRSRAFAYHRAHSYYHEIIVDLGYYLPLRYLIAADSALRLIDFTQLLQHSKVPAATRKSPDPLLVTLRDADLRFDGTPHIIARRARDGDEYSLFLPGIQVDRGTETFAKVETHILHALEFVDGHHYERHWGSGNCVIPFLFTKAARKDRALKFLQQHRGKCAFLLFQTIPDLGLQPHFPRPQHYDRSYQPRDGEWVPPEAIHIFTQPWQRAGLPDFDLLTLGGSVT
jgi:hypothetical protein